VTVPCLVVWLWALARAEDCATCHAPQAYTHSLSRHAAAFSNPSFQAAWTRHPDPWCLSCHRRDGIACQDCHGELVTTGPSPAAADAPHDLLVADDFGTTTCAPCHDVLPPGATVALQTTMQEHMPATGSCASCHLPDGDHQTLGARDHAFVRGALEVDWSGTGADRVARVRARGVGHRVPTGDPFRQLLLEVGAGDQVLDRARFGRAVDGTGDDLTVRFDTRLPAPSPGAISEKTVRLDADGASWWRLRFDLVDPFHTELAGDERGWTVHEGTFPAPAAAPGVPQQR